MWFVVVLCVIGCLVLLCVFVYDSGIDKLMMVGGFVMLIVLFMVVGVCNVMDDLLCSWM